MYVCLVMGQEKTTKNLIKLLSLFMNDFQVNKGTLFMNESQSNIVKDAAEY